MHHYQQSPWDRSNRIEITSKKMRAGGINPPAALKCTTTVEGLEAKLQGQLDGSGVIGARDLAKVTSPKVLADAV